MIKKILLLFSVSLFFLGCTKEDLTPSWLKIEPFTLTTDPSSQGVNSHAITNVWLFMDSKSLGVFELPCVVPILDEGNHTFELIPGVKNNGISAKRIQYPFYKIFTIDGKLTLNDTLTIFPTTEYKSGTEFSYIEDFEGDGFSLIKGPSSCSKSEKALLTLFIIPILLSGKRTIRACSAKACKMDCLIHQTA